VNPDVVVSPELARSMTELSREMGRQLGLLMDRRGNVEAVIVGDAKGIEIAEMGRYRVGRIRFRGLRVVHTHLDASPLNQDDLTDLALLRFDLMVAIQALDNGLPGTASVAHLRPGAFEGEPWVVEGPQSVHQLTSMDFQQFIESLEQEFAAEARTRAVDHGTRRAVLIGVSADSVRQAHDSMEELAALADSAGIEVLDRVMQRRQRVDARTLVGPGKLKEIFIRCLQLDADMLIFDRELSGSQVRAIAEMTDLEVIDRTQMILDIFARRAHSREGKIQVELAQLKYSLPRLVLKDDFLSRITGGIGLKGPGETKMEVLRRRVRDRITALEKEIKSLAKGRDERRKSRQRAGLPVVSIVGYTNAGKSTLFNKLTDSNVFVENRLFATLDPTTRRVRFPEEREVVMADTVGFMQDLPEDLVAAFRATLEELREATLLLHVVDISNPDRENQMAAVNEILSDLAIDAVPQLVVFNKCDLVSPEEVEEVRERFGGIMISALQHETLPGLIEVITRTLWEGSVGARLPAASTAE
jgi:GTP-binding protein HflX